MKPPKILCIHGIGGKDATIDKWSHDWRKALKNILILLKITMWNL